MDYQATATYCIEDDKLRMYTGYVDRALYLRLKNEGWASTPKQACDFVAYWTESREDQAFELCGYIGDEDQSPEDRAADRAQRFGEYRENRLADALTSAGDFESTALAHGYQSADKANKAAARHARTGKTACSNWSKAEYWIERTRGVINNALHKSTPGVRMGRIRKLEASQRKIEKNITRHNRQVKRWQALGSIKDPDKRKKILEYLCDSCWASFDGNTLNRWYSGGETWEQLQARYLATYHEITQDSRGLVHIKRRLNYERAVLEAEGGRAGGLDIQIGGFIGKYQIHKVHKSPATGRVVSVSVLQNAPEGWAYRTKRIPGTDKAYAQLNVERLDPKVYKAPTNADKETVRCFNAARKAAAPKKIPLINPTLKSARALQTIFNEQACTRWRSGTPANIREMTQAQYSAVSGGSYARAETRAVTAAGVECKRTDTPAYKIRVYTGAGPLYSADQVIVLTDKPQKTISLQVAAEKMAV